MRRMIGLIICLCMASVASALSITNGDFETGTTGVNWDVHQWFDYGDDTLEKPSAEYANGNYEGPFQFKGGGTLPIQGTGSVFCGERANEDEDGGNHAYIYQSIGIYDGTFPAVDIEMDWTVPNITFASSGELGVTVMILEQAPDGPFEPNEWDGAPHDIYGFVKTAEQPDLPVTEIGRGTAFRYVQKGAAPMHERFQIDLSAAAVGNELFLRINGYKGALEKNANDKEKPWVVMDNVTMSIAYILNQAPASFVPEQHNYVAVELEAAGNDLVFDVTDDSIIEVDVLLGTDPNLPYPDSVIATVDTPAAGQYTVNLETGLPAGLLQDGHLQWEKDYYWKVIAHKEGGGTYEGLPTSFRTIQYGPLLEDVTPNIQGVWAGDEAVFRLEYYNKVDTFQWYKEGQAGNPDVALANGAKYAGADSNSLTIYDCQTADEGLYYCVGTETVTGAEAQSTAGGELAIKELKSYYPFETTASDAHGTYTPDVIGQKHAYLRGGASLANTDPIGAHGSYLKLDNPRNETHTQYAEFLDDSVAHHQDITISCWVRPELLDLDFEQYARVFDFGTDEENYFFLTMLEHSNTASCHMTDADPDDQHVEAVGDIGYGTQWIYVVLTIEDITELNDAGQEETTTTAKIYLNGTHGGEGGLDHPSEIDKTDNYLGRAIAAPDSGSYPNFNGMIDELKIYNYAKTAEEIAQEYMAVRTQTPFICNRDVYDLQDWDFDDNCEIGLPDLVILAGKWLENYLVYPD